ncbi:MAG: hypothetical protein RLZZ136_1294 [Pseudomonadota bacterium]
MSTQSKTPIWKTTLSDSVSRIPATLPANLRVRIVGLDDLGQQRRLDWLGTWITSDDVFTYTPENMRILAQAYRGYDVIVLHGNDASAMAPILQQWRRALNGKAIVAILPDHDAPAHAALLKAGADTVIDLDKPASVATAMVCALIRRTQAAIDAPAA